MQRNQTSLLFCLTIGLVGLLWLIQPIGVTAHDAHRSLSFASTLSSSLAVTGTQTVTATAVLTKTPAITTTAAVTKMAAVAKTTTVTKTATVTTTAAVTATRGVTTPVVATTTAVTKTTAVTPAQALAAAPAPSNCQQLVVNGNFEARTGWRLLVTPYPGAYSAEKVFEGKSSLRLGLLDKDRNVFSFSTGYQLIRLPANAKTITLKALVWRGSTSTADHDFQYLIVDPQHGRPQRVFLAPSNSQKWEPIVYDATALKGQLVRLIFGTYNNGRAGKTIMYVDTVSLESCK